MQAWSQCERVRSVVMGEGTNEEGKRRKRGKKCENQRRFEVVTNSQKIVLSHVL